MYVLSLPGSRKVSLLLLPVWETWQPAGSTWLPSRGRSAGPGGAARIPPGGGCASKGFKGRADVKRGARNATTDEKSYEVMNMPKRVS